MKPTDSTTSTNEASGVALAKQGLCEFCKCPTEHGPWTDAQIAEVVADLGCALDDFSDFCDDCFVVHVGLGCVETAQRLVDRPLQLLNPEHLAQLKHLKFLAAGKALQDFRAKYGEGYRHAPESIPLFEEFLKHAPPEVHQKFLDKAKDLDLLPEATHVNDAGEPVYSAEQIAEKFGVPVEQVEKDLREKFGNRLEVGNVHPLQ